MQVHFEVSAATEDPSWDAFVEAHPWGQLQQLSLWAKAKSSEGWQASRLLWKAQGRIVGGAQVLTKDTRAGRVAWIYKGPLFDLAWSEAESQALAALTDQQRARKWRALLLQPPDLGASLEGPLRRFGFHPEHLLKTIDSTLVVDLTEGWDQVQARLRRTARRDTRRALKQGVTIEEGTEEDLPDFFQLMASTCHAQGAQPHPGSVEALRALWKPFHTAGRARLWFATHQGTRIAGGLCLVCGPRVWFWKKGWNQKNPELYANLLLTFDALRWASEQGYHSLDFVSLDRDLAEDLVAGREPASDQLHRRDFFNLGFGGNARLLPRCLIRFRHPLVAAGYRIACAEPWKRTVRNLLHRAGFA